MGLAILRYCIIGLVILVCIAIGFFRLLPSVEGLLAILIIVVLGVFFQNERGLFLLRDVLKELQTKK